MRVCPRCGLSISETATFCQVCGARVEAGPVTEPVAEPVVFQECVAAGEPESQPRESTDAPAEHHGVTAAALIDDAAACEDADPAAAAARLREAIFAGLDALAQDPGSACACRDLLCGFDRLSALLQREGMLKEALEVADETAALGLLSGTDEAAAWYRDAVRDRREDLRRTLSPHRLES